MNARTSLAVLLVVFAVVVAGTAGLVAAGSDQGTTAENTTAKYDLGDLDEGGQTIEGKNPSERWLGYQGSVYASFENTNWVKEIGQPQAAWTVDNVVGPGSLVDTNEVTLHFSRKRGAESETVHLKTVYWERKTKPVTQGNTTTQEPYAANVTVETKEIELSGSGDTVTKELRNHPDHPVRVTMWIQEYPDSRWTFEHHSIATTSELPFAPTWPSFLSWFGLRFLGLTAVGVPLAIGAAVKSIETAKAPPGKSAMWYVVMGGMASYMGLYFWYGEVAGLLVSAPWLMGAAVVVLAYLTALEKVDRTKKLRLESLQTIAVENPLGKSVPDIEHELGNTFNVVEEDGVISFFKAGSLKQFLIRLAGAKPASIDVSGLTSRVRYSGDADEKLYIDEESIREDDETGEKKLLKLTFPALSISASNLKTTVEESADDGGTTTVEQWDRDKLSTAFFGFGVGTLIGAQVLGTLQLGALVGMLPVLWVMANLQDGSADLVTAPDHATTGKARAVTEANEVALQKTFTELQESIADSDVEAIEKAVEIGEAYTRRAKDQMNRIMGAGGSEPDKPAFRSDEVTADD
ncbi:hypothetical protein ACFQH6_19380 [Halobacteriaceae archaeon GCM10025711]